LRNRFPLKNCSSTIDQLLRLTDLEKETVISNGVWAGIRLFWASPIMREVMDQVDTWSERTRVAYGVKPERAKSSSRGPA